VCAGLNLLGSGNTRLGLEDMRIPPARNEPWCREARTSRWGHTPWLSVQVHTAPKSSMPALRRMKSVGPPQPEDRGRFGSILGANIPEHAGALVCPSKSVKHGPD
jgi:hypothetical protein